MAKRPEDWTSSFFVMALVADVVASFIQASSRRVSPPQSVHNPGARLGRGRAGLTRARLAERLFTRGYRALLRLDPSPRSPV